MLMHVDKDLSINLSNDIHINVTYIKAKNNTLYTISYNVML